MKNGRGYESCKTKEKVKLIITKSQVPGMTDEEYQEKINTVAQ